MDTGLDMDIGMDTGLDMDMDMDTGLDMDMDMDMDTGLVVPPVVQLASAPPQGVVFASTTSCSSST